MIKSTLFTKQMHFYACKIQIKSKPYPISCNRNTIHHHYHTTDTASIASLHAKLKFSLWSASSKLLNFQFKIKLQSIAIDLICQ